MLWNAHGVIPPVIDNDGTNLQRSPYEINIVDFVKLFATSQERIVILKGLIEYRLKLYEIGIKNGFQWVDGSFTESVETTRNRPPNDIDIVNFADLSSIDESVIKQNSSLFDNNYNKSHYKVDGYWVNLNQPLKDGIKNCTYWYSMWSHQKQTNLWKGFFSIDFGDDHAASEFLDKLDNELSHA